MANGVRAGAGRITIDFTIPDVAIDEAAQVVPIGATAVHFTAAFTEPVTGFEARDVALAGSAGATTAVLSGGPAVYDVAVSGMTAAGTVIATIPAGAAVNGLGNPSTASTSTDNSIAWLPAPAPPPPPPVAGPPPPQPPPPAVATAPPMCEGAVATIVARGQPIVRGSALGDVIVGTDRGETIDGGGGDDTICAGRGADVVRAGRGADLVRGGAGGDRLAGQGGDDLLLGGPGADDIRGDAGNDRLGSGSGDDRVDGGAGDDVFDEVKLGGNGSDRLRGGSGRDRIRTYGGTGDDVDCGRGPDFAILDRRDRARRCEAIHRVTR